MSSNRFRPSRIRRALTGRRPSWPNASRACSACTFMNSDSDTDLTALGLTSMMTAQVVEWSATRSGTWTSPICMPNRHCDNWQRLFDTAPPTPAHNSGTTGSDTFTMTALQRAYWIGRGAEQPLGGVGCQTYFELGGATIDPGRLDAALDALAHRHPMLRSMFPDADRCRIAPENIHAPVQVHDLTEATDAARGRHLDEVRNRLRTHRFGIETGDTWRVELTRLPDRYILHFAIDLIIADLTSIGIFLRDLAALYRGDELPDRISDFRRSCPHDRQPSLPATPSNGSPSARSCPGPKNAKSRSAVEQHTLDTHRDDGPRRGLPGPRSHPRRGVPGRLRPVCCDTGAAPTTS